MLNELLKLEDDAEAMAIETSSPTPMVSVVIPVRNDAVRLEKCLISVAALDYPPDALEIIVIDNGSRDDSANVARRFATQVLSYPDLKVGALRNRGVAASSGEIVAFVDSDHEVPRDWLQTAVQQFQLDPELMMLGAPCLAPPDGTWVQRSWEGHRLRHAVPHAAHWLGAGNMFIRRSDFDRLKGFREDLTASEDVDLCERLRAGGGRIVCDPRVTNIHHGEPKSLWQFFRKEWWRGSSGVKTFLAHGMPLHELPSMVFPVYHLLLLVLAVVTLVVGWYGESFAALYWSLILLLLPSAVLAVRTGIKVRRLRAIPALSVLYFTYGMARALALFR